MLSEPDVSDKEFAAAFTEMEVAHVLEMRQMLAALLGIDPRKIRAEWRFREERHLKNMDLFILEAFVDKYAPDKLRDHHSFVFPANNVSTVRDLFLEVGRLKGNG